MFDLETFRWLEAAIRDAVKQGAPSREAIEAALKTHLPSGAGVRVLPVNEKTVKVMVWPAVDNMGIMCELICQM